MSEIAVVDNYSNWYDPIVGGFTSSSPIFMTVDFAKTIPGIAASIQSRQVWMIHAGQSIDDLQQQQYKWHNKHLRHRWSDKAREALFQHTTRNYAIRITDLPVSLTDVLKEIFPYAKDQQFNRLWTDNYFSFSSEESKSLVAILGIPILDIEAERALYQSI